MPSAKPAPPRRRWTLWLRFAVSAALLGILIAKINFENLVPERAHLATFAWLIAGLLAAVFGIVLSAWRWQRVLAAFDVHVPVRSLLSHNLAGQFVGNVLPTTIGGDVLRVSRGARTTSSTEVAFASVVLERLTGFLVLPLLTILGFLARPSLLDEDRAWLALVIAGVTLLVLVILLFVAGHARLAGRFAEHESWMRFIGAVHIGVDRLRREPIEALGVVGAALAYQVAWTVLVVLCAVKTLDLPLPLAAVLAYAPAVASIQVLPISISGLGVREAMLVIFFVPLGISSGQAVGVGLLWYAIVLVVSLLGAPLFAVGHRHGAPTATAAS
ncbi:MAG: lysylphosphatidylglycerol synthase transmembrane domain-containing protein [Acidimicrobiia bacterium]